MITSRILPSFLFFVLASSALHAQKIPCLVGRGSAPDGWSDQDDTPIAAMLRQADAARNDPSPKLNELFSAVLVAAEALPDTDPCKARAFSYAARFYGAFDSGKALALQQRVVAIDKIALPVGNATVAIDVRQLAFYYGLSHKLVEEGQCYVRALDLAENAQRMTSLERIFTFISAATFYEQQKDYSRAEALLNRASDFTSDLPTTLKGEFVPAIRAQLSHVLREDGKQEEADALLDQSVPPYPLPASPQGPSRLVDLSGPLSDMTRAKGYLAEGNEQQAEVAYLGAISAFENMGTATVIAQADLEGALGELGKLYRKEHRYAEAESVLLRGFQIWERLPRPPKSNWAPFTSCLDTLEAVYKDQGRLAEIEPFYQRTLADQERSQVPNGFLFTTITGLKNVYREEKKYDLMLPLLQRELAIEEHMWGTHNQLLVGTLQDYAQTLEKVDRPDEAAALRARIAELQK